MPARDTPNDSQPQDDVSPLAFDEVIAPDPLASLPPPPIECWRCGRTNSPETGSCCWCQARLTSQEPSQVGSRTCSVAPPGEWSFIATVLTGYGIMLVVSVLWGWVLLASSGRMTTSDVVTGTTVVEIVDTVLTGFVLLLVGRQPVQGTTRFRSVAWTTACPILFFLLVANVAYFALLRDVLKLGEPTGKTDELTPVSILLNCVQPAIVEEVFFRYIALGVLSRVTSGHSAVWVTAVMFAMAHIYNPLGLPYLFLAGVVFGYARVWGGLGLPIVMHFVHNLVVGIVEV